MENGLTMDLEQFKKLPIKQQLTVLYDNQCKTLKLINGYKLYYRITSIIGSLLMTGMGYLLIIHLK
jgi:hypothetical protein